MSSTSLINLPPFLEIKETIHSGRGIYTKESIKTGRTIFASKAYAFGVGGVTAKDVRALCNHCLVRVCGTPVVCDDCRVVGYCSAECLDAALPLHAMECKGILRLEKLRTIHVHTSSSPGDCTGCWPPVYALMVARIINKRILLGEDRGGDWVNYLSYPDKLPPAKEKLFSNVTPYVRYLVPSDVSNLEIHHTFRVVCSNGASVYSPTDTSAVATYIEYSLLNHMCKPNCGWEEENGAMSVFALEDIKAGDQLGISYLLPEYCLYVREVRRKELMDVFGFNCQCFVCLGEEVVGSKYWLLDQQKRSLITPWSHQMVQVIMERGWEMVCPRRLTLSPSQVIQMLELEVGVQKLYLDESNVILILTAKVLISKYSELGEMEKAIDCFMSVGESGMITLLQYGTVFDAAQIMDMVAMSYLKLGRMEEFHNMTTLMQQLFPRRPSADSIRDLLGLKHTKEDNQTAKDWERGKEIPQVVLKAAIESGSFNLPYGIDIEKVYPGFRQLITATPDVQRTTKQVTADATNNSVLESK